MICIEKLRELYPECSEDEINKMIDGHCPSYFYIARDPEYCEETIICINCLEKCDECWSREAESDDTLYTEIDASLGNNAEEET